VGADHHCGQIQQIFPTQSKRSEKKSPPDKTKKSSLRDLRGKLLHHNNLPNKKSPNLTLKDNPHLSTGK
ncbi:MAG: hypothetical protein KAS23_13675, partial [Anaerohalosphaera sp.]|nr:hypothetical protein [Anaerohalosphaera sp.]